MQTVVDAIAGSGRGGGTLTVIDAGSSAETRLAWSAVHERARRMASVLAQHGIGRGSRVGLLGDTSAGLVTAIQAVWLCGAAFTLLPLPSRAGQQARLAHLLAILADARCDMVIVDELSSDAGTALADAALVRSLSDLELAAQRVVPFPTVRPELNDLAILQYTSGSTRSPRGVPVTHANLAANLNAIEATIGRGALDPATASWMSWLPLYHDMGLIGFLALPMSRGCSLVLQSPMAFALRPATWLERIERHRVTFTGAPNFAYALMTPLLETGSVTDLSTLRHMISGGEPIDAATMARFTTAAERHGLDPRAMVAAYGLAESTLAVSFSSPRTGITVDEVDREAFERLGRVQPAIAGRTSRSLVRLGPAVPGTRIRIVDPRTGAPVAARTVGQVEVGGVSVVDGYWGQTPPSSPSSWLSTGDLGYVTDDDLVVCGRAKDVLFAAGRNIFPQDVEAAAAQVPGVRAGGVGAFGIPTDRGDRLVIAVEFRGGDGTALRRAIAVAVADDSGMAPADVVMLRPGSLPKTSSGKLRRAEIRRRFLDGELRESSVSSIDRSIR